MATRKIILAHSDPQLGNLLENSILRPAGYEVTYVAEQATTEALVKSTLPDLIIIGEMLRDGNGLELVGKLFATYPNIPIILIASQPSPALMQSALRNGACDCLIPPMHSNDVLAAVERAFQRRKTVEEWAQLEAHRNTRSLRLRLDSLEALQKVGRAVTASLDLDNVLTTVVDAAVELSGAEEGSLLLLDETTGDLYMRAARNFQEDFVRTFRLPIRDTLAGQVLRTGEPITFNEKTPQKIKTSYLVHTLIYMPLKVQGRVIGVLGVDNRQSGHPFTEDHITLITALAGFAAIAIENARLFTHSEVERNKLETILTQVEDGVVVVGLDGQIILVNRTARSAFTLEDIILEGKPAKEIFQHPDMLDIFEDNKIHVSRTEINLDDGRVLNAQITPIPEVGLAITMQDITQLKELDRIKTDFVNTVSHDLRSPLTAILGYVELIDRAGPTTEQQKEFIRRVQFSVNNITTLINDLLDLGRIEAGFDARKEIVPLPAIIQYAVEGLRNRYTEKNQTVTMDIPKDLPSVLGNPVRLRQMIANLVNNSIKFTPVDGKVAVRARSEAGQLILQVVDNGSGIPPADQPYIFDKFYRGSNIPYDAPGTGLGLAIVKSIVENHQGRIWLNSTANQGTVFTVVLPIAEQTKS
jgi:two-component system NtrC family sensor kinase